MYGSLDISTSGMIAQRIRMAAISANIANANTILDANGQLNPFRKRMVFFSPGNPSAQTAAGRRLGVHVASIEADESAVKPRYMPSSPYADENGYVPYPDISAELEQINAMQAARSYEANVVAAETTKQMMAQALRLLA
ncbi:MAG: flagellar basal body rod protein FlgC [Planctomycetota bacterium]|nr:MAG: flagellar basal body rod protein FlgC [Planctomycetota bacterium]